MSIEVEVDISALEEMFSPERMDAANELLTNQVMQSVQSEGDNPEGGYAPYRTGHLHQSATVTGPDEFTYTEDYASYVYNGTSRQAAQPWFENAKADHLADWVVKALEDVIG